MRPALLALLTPLLALTLSCEEEQEPEIQGAKGSPSKEDIVDVTDLLVGQGSSAGAILAGDPAELLASARAESTVSVGRLKPILLRLQEIAAGRNPERRGTYEGLPYGVWSGIADGVEVKHLVTVLSPGKMRYLTLGKKPGSPGDYRPILTGIFQKTSANRGGGRLRLDLTALADLGGGNADGVVHFWWSNRREGVVARRLLHRNVKDRGGPYPEPRNHGTDYLQEVGVRGVYRALAVGDLAPKLAGDEALALRMRWTPGQGGGADAVLVNPQNKARVKIRECWDEDGKRTAYQNDASFDDGDNPDVGDVSSCWGYAPQEAPEDPFYNEVDEAPEVVEALQAAGALGIPESEASDATRVE
jgi:hypothetical protein